MEARAEDLRIKASGQMHADAFEALTDREASKRIGRSRRTANNWRHGQKGSVPDSILSYMLNAPDPWRVRGEIDAALKQAILENETDAELIEGFWLQMEHEVDVEAADTHFHNRHPDSRCWMEWSQAKKRDSAVNSELSARMVQFAIRGLTWEDVLAGRPE